MDTMTAEPKKKRQERSPELEARIPAECDRPGASIAKVALAHDLDADLVHGWRRLEAPRSPTTVPSPTGSSRCADATGSSMPSACSQGPRRCWPVCFATRSASPAGQVQSGHWRSSARGLPRLLPALAGTFHGYIGLREAELLVEGRHPGSASPEHRLVRAGAVSRGWLLRGTGACRPEFTRIRAWLL